MAKPRGPIAIYTRLSVDRTGDAPSLKRQEDACREFIESRGFEIGHVYSDSDASAYKKVVRPGFDQMMAAVENGDLGGVCVWKLDRLTRRFTQSAEILQKLLDARAILLSVNDHVETETPMGQALVGLLIAQAQTESQNTSLRVSDAENTNAKLGRPHGGGKRSFGYDRGEHGVLTINPAEAEQLSLVAADLRAGISLRAATKRLNERGSLTPTGRQWTRASLAQTLRSPKLRGVRIHKGRQYAGIWDPIFDEAEQFELLELVSSGYRQSPERKRNQSLLSGMIFCGVCESRLFLSKDKVGDGTYYYRYTCQTNPGTSACGSVSVARDPLEALVVDRATYYESQNGAEVSTRREDQDLEAQRLENVISADRQELTNLLREKHLNRTKDNDLLYDDVRVELEDRIATNLEILRDLQTEQARRSRDELVLRKVNDLPWHPKQPFAIRRAWLRRYVARITINPALVRGAKFDERRVQIEWTLGPFEPEPYFDENEAAEAWNDYQRSK